MPFLGQSLLLSTIILNDNSAESTNLLLHNSLSMGNKMTMYRIGIIKKVPKKERYTCISTYYQSWLPSRSLMLVCWLTLQKIML